MDPDTAEISTVTSSGSGSGSGSWVTSKDVITGVGPESVDESQSQDSIDFVTLGMFIIGK